MPDDRDAVSACLPLWDDNIAYEEGDPRVVDHLQAAYPRFCIHPDVRGLCEHLFPRRAGLPFVTAAAAERAVAYVRHAGGRSATVKAIPNQPCVGVEVDPEELPLLKQYWQHAGELVSSRMARRILADDPVTFTQTAARSIVRQRVADLHQTSADNVYLFASGMGAIAAAWRTINEHSSGRPTCQFGFPYVDTLKIQERFPDACHTFLPMGTAANTQTLAELFPTQRFSTVFCETPTNPLLITPDLKQLRQITQQNNALLVIDDTLRACSQQSVLPGCDMAVTSLTKYFSGYGNVLAGAMVLNPAGEHYTALKSRLNDTFEESLSDIDVDILENNSRDFEARICENVKNARLLVARLRQHSAVADVFYPNPTDETDTSTGALFSIVLKNAETTTPIVFNKLRISKGPNLGTNFTLCCPYTILAHFTELDFAERCGASRWLLRFSAGVEPIEELWSRFVTALEPA
jgi:cystathionine gamma-synthase